MRNHYNIFLPRLPKNKIFKNISWAIKHLINISRLQKPSWPLQFFQTKGGKFFMEIPVFLFLSSFLFFLVISHYCFWFTIVLHFIETKSD